MSQRPWRRSSPFRRFIQFFAVVADVAPVSLPLVSEGLSEQVGLGLPPSAPPGNTATLKQLNAAITKNGFTMKDSTAAVAGTVISADGKATLHVSGSDDVLQLEPQSGAAPALSMVGKTVMVDGVVPEAPKGKAPDSIRYLSIAEERPK